MSSCYGQGTALRTGDTAEANRVPALVDAEGLTEKGTFERRHKRNRRQAREYVVHEYPKGGIAHEKVLRQEVLEHLGIAMRLVGEE